ncbi:hypothetical protein AB3X52_01025 [Nocardioides sp. DS6]|uniref:HNH endonuclease n=1 Tax=Nocardioides eburneus TaxID=3231482 RepID=A0ABV3SUZ8_9ACTN
MSKQICYHGWSFDARDEKHPARHVADVRHRCGLPPGHDGTCVCRECGQSPQS